MSLFPASSLAMYSGRPGTLSVEDFGDRLLANYAKAKSKDTRLTKARFLEQLPGFLEQEALRSWRKNKDRVLTAPAVAAELAQWDPLEEVVRLFKTEFGGASAEQVRELTSLKKKPNETCRMLHSRLEYLADETGLLNSQEMAIKFVEALPEKLRVRVEPIVYSMGANGVYTLDQAFKVADRQDLATAYADGRRGKTKEDTSTDSYGVSEADAKAFQDGRICFRCGREGHVLSECQVKADVQCSVCQKKGHMAAACWTKHGKPGVVANQRAYPQEGVKEIALELKELKGQVQKLLEHFGRVVNAKSGAGQGMDKY